MCLNGNSTCGYRALFSVWDFVVYGFGRWTFPALTASTFENLERLVVMALLW